MNDDIDNLIQAMGEAYEYKKQYYNSPKQGTADAYFSAKKEAVNALYKIIIDKINENR